MAMFQDDAAAANRGLSLESEYFLQNYGLEENEGWVPEGKDTNAPYYRNYLDATFRSLGASGDDANNAYWVHGLLA